ncbi:MAG: translation initiation factor [Puniceicoccaceae bacterium]
MSRKKERIDTSGGENLSADNPFASLGGLDLPQAKPVQPQPAGEKRRGQPKKRETLLLRRLKAGKGGKVVTEISGFTGAPEVHQRLLKELQAALGTGGTCKGRVLELQGECREKLKPLLESRGYPVKGI